MDKETIKVGDYIIIQRQNYMKLHKLKENSKTNLGNFQIELNKIIGEKYSEIFQMKNIINEEKPFNQRNNNNLFKLEKVTQLRNKLTKIVTTNQTEEDTETTIKDNRNIIDDGKSQLLTKNEITELKNSELNSNNIVGKLINNSTTFSKKTEYSQEKYIKKKEKKYFEFIKILKPTIRLLAELYYRQEPIKILNLRIDILSQILNYANIQSCGNHLLYDSGTQGLVPAAILNLIGPKTEGKLIHMHPGNECQKTAFQAMKFPQEQAERCINVNLYSVLRCYYQEFNTSNYQSDNDKEKSKNETTDPKSTETTNENQSKTSNNKESETTERKESETTDQKESETTNQKESETTNQKESETTDQKESETTDQKESETTDQKESETTNQKESETTEDSNEPPAKRLKRPQWHFDNLKACELLKNKFDSLIILTSKDYPINILKELLEFLNGNRNFVIFHTLREPLQDLYIYLKTRNDIIQLNIIENFLRYYQVLNERTHPEMSNNLNSNTGYILTGYKLLEKK